MNLKTPFIVLRSLVYLIITVLVVLFALKNNSPTTLRFLLNAEWTAPLSVILMLSLLLGVLIGFSLGGVSLFRLMRSREKKLKIKQDKEREKVEASKKSTTPHETNNKSASAGESPVAVVPLLPTA